MVCRMGEFASEVGAALYARAGVDPERLPRRRTIEIALRLHGGDCIVLQPRACAEATVAAVAGRQKIVIRRGTPGPRANWLVARMLVRLELARRGIRSERIECAGAAWLVAPTETFLSHVDSHTWNLDSGDIERVAEMFAVPCTCAMMRIPEVGGPAVAVLTPQRVYKRGQQLSWLDDDYLRTLAARRQLRSVRRLEIPDEPGRVALLARVA